MQRKGSSVEGGKYRFIRKMYRRRWEKMGHKRQGRKCKIVKKEMEGE